MSDQREKDIGAVVNYITVHCVHFHTFNEMTQKGNSGVIYIVQFDYLVAAVPLVLECTCLYVY